MGSRTKAFDCVEMKRRAQQQLREEYERRSDEFESYGQFLCARADELELTQAIRAKIAAARERERQRTDGG